MNPFLISTKCPMLFGCGTSMTVASKIQELGCKKVMIVCDDWLSKQENALSGTECYMALYCRYAFWFCFGPWYACLYRRHFGWSCWILRK